jgi:putative nucleic acid binding protein
MIRNALRAVLVIFVGFMACGICLSLRPGKTTAPPGPPAPNLATATTGAPGGTAQAAKKTQQPRREPKRQTESIGAEQLIADYHRNEVAADGRYKGRTFLVSGAVDTIGKDFVGSAYLTLGGDGFQNVRCDLGRSLQPEVAQLQPGDPVVVSGEVTGMILGSPMLSSCSLRTVPRR